MTAHDGGALDGFLRRLPFVPDAFQVEAIAHLERGASVVVTAPTGAGKTLVAEAAIELAMRRGLRTFYTTPIKALSNQKFGDLRAAYGEDLVGLLTGDNVINGEAPIVVMTTEVLRNMIYADVDRLADLGVVVLDEVHYLQDRYRGSVWEEVIIHLPRRIQLVNLSATIANAEEFTEWVRARRGDTALVEETHRPVPLESLYMVKDLHREHRIDMLPVFDRTGRRPNPAVVNMLRKGQGRHRRFVAPRRLDVTEELQRLGMVPAIYFIFSRAGCDQAAELVAAAGLGLATMSERAEIRRVAEARTAHLSPEDLAVLGYDRWLVGLEVGVAAHHAGLVPAFKETVETLFAAGLIKVVFATETLALGINMPAKTVVIERLSKFDGESHEILQPGDYTQLTGRAGRRGIDTAGTAIVLHQRDIPFDRVAGIAAAGSHPLTSSFSPSYNMAVNLVANYPRTQAEELLHASFAQHRLEAQRGALVERIDARAAEAAEFREKARCDHGDVAAYAAGGGVADLRRRMRELAQGLLPGDVIEVPGAEVPLRWVMVARGYGPNPKLVLVGEDGVRRIGAAELGPGAAVVGAVELPEPYRPRERAYQRAVRQALQAMGPASKPDAVDESNHDPVASCPDLGEHLAWLDRAEKVDKEVARLRRRVDKGTGDLVQGFRSLLRLLGDWGYVDGWKLTPKGERLRFVYNELDLLVAESAERGLLDGLSAPELAGALTVFVYEPRRDDVAGGMPTEPAHHAVEGIFAVSDELAEAEDRRRIGLSRPPDDGYVQRLHDWGSGAGLDDLFDDEASAGNFVRIARQTLDLLRQVRDVYPALRRPAAQAIERVDRGVVAAEGGA